MAEREVDADEVEEVLYAHPAVRDAAVVAMPDPYAGERPLAVIALKDGQSPTAVVAVNSYDPFTDNADGIAGMAELAHEVRIITDALDAVIGQADVGKQLTDSLVTME